MTSRRLPQLIVSSIIASLLLLQFACSFSSKSAKVTPSPSPGPIASPEPSPTETPIPVAVTEAPMSTGSSRPARSAAPSSPNLAPAQTTAPRTTPPPASLEPSRPVSTPTPLPPPRTFTIRPGTPLTVYTSTAMSSKSSRRGDTFVGSLSEAIVDGDWVIAKRGAAVEGVITNADEGGRVNGLASIAVELRRLTLADGRTVAIDTTPYTRSAKSSVKKDAAKIGIGAGIGAAIGAIAGGGKGAAIGAGIGGGAGTGVVVATRGEPAVIPGESALSVRLTSPVTVTKRQ
jgi:hypothetical protein